MEEIRSDDNFLNSQKIKVFEKNSEQVSPSYTVFPDLMAKDLETLLSNYNDPKKGLRILSHKTGIHEKTLTRILQKENRPSPQTLLKFYRHFHGIYNDLDLLKVLNKELADYLYKYLDQDTSKELEYSHQSDSFLLKNPVAHELFLLAATAPLRHETIVSKFGQYGQTQLNKLIELKILKELQTHLYVLGTNRPNFEEAMILKSGLIMSEAYANLEKSEELDQNFMGFYIEGLTEEAYQQWLAIDDEAFRKKMTIVKDKNNLGPEKVFTFMISERIEYKQKTNLN